MLRHYYPPCKLEAIDLYYQHRVENKVFDNGTIDGYIVAAIDGTKFFGTNKKSCPECIKNAKGNKTHFFHSGTVMSTVGNGSKLVGLGYAAVQSSAHTD